MDPARMEEGEPLKRTTDDEDDETEADYPESTRNIDASLCIRIHKFMSQNWYLTYLLPVTILVVVIIAMYFCRNYARALLLWIEHQNPWLIFSVFMFMFVVVSFPITVGYLVLIITSGYLFGCLKGFLTVILGANLGVAIAHNTIRSIQNKLPVHRLIKNETARAILRVISGPRAFKVVMFTRLTPIPFGLQNTIFGVSSVSPRSYHTGTFIGLLPAQAINVYLGSTLRSMHDVLNNHNTALTGYVVFSIQVMIGVGLMIWVIQKAKHELSEALLSDIGTDHKTVQYKYLATGASFNTLAFDYLMGASTIRRITKTTCEQIWNILQPLYMATKEEDDWIKIADEFYSRTNFPNIIGAIDGKHIRMVQPEHSGSTYFNYKKFFSCVLMAWTDADYKFVYIDVGSYGTASDSETSEMGKRLSENRLNIPAGRHLPNDGDGNVIPFSVVGDEAFGLGNHILRPYAKRHLNYTKRIFNYRHTRARRMVECTFGIFANKWRIFHRPIDVDINFCVRIIKACCVLHNFVRIKDGVKFTDTLYSCPMKNLKISENNRGRNNMSDVRQYMSSYFISPTGAIPCQYSKV